MLAAQPGNADRFVIAGIAGLAVAAACLAVGRGSENFPLILIIGVAAGMALCICCEFALIRAVYRYSRSVPYGDWKTPPYSVATKAMQAMNGLGALCFLGGFIISFLRDFGVEDFDSGLVGVGLIFLGLVFQMLGQARYLKRMPQATR